MAETERFNEVAYRMDAEGFDYCFNGYSDWSNIEDPIFHHLRMNYIAAQKALESYVKEQSDGGEW